jgi:plasmid maintenance system antidote protein VapI
VRSPARQPGPLRDPNLNRFVDAGELAEILGLHRNTVNRLAKAGALPARRVGEELG